MTSNEILKADMLDILFDNRNKQYGAYTLRKYYHQHLGAGLGVSVAIFLLLFLLVHPSKPGPQTANNVPGVVISEMPVPKEIKKPEPPRAATPPPARKVAQEQFLEPRIVERPKIEMPTQNAIRDAVISDITVAGPKISDYADPLPIPQHGNGNPGPKAESKPEGVVELVQREPEFPGGAKAWLDFLNRNLIVPADLEAGEKKMVMIRFLVGADGRVTAFEVAQSGGREYDNEVIRVLKRMPKWKPAIQNGQPVGRSFTQPVTFMGLE